MVCKYIHGTDQPLLCLGSKKLITEVNDSQYCFSFLLIDDNCMLIKVNHLKGSSIIVFLQRLIADTGRLACKAFRLHVDSPILRSTCRRNDQQSKIVLSNTESKQTKFSFYVLFNSQLLDHYWGRSKTCKAVMVTTLRPGKEWRRTWQKGSVSIKIIHRSGGG